VSYSAVKSAFKKIFYFAGNALAYYNANVVVLNAAFVGLVQDLATLNENEAMFTR
jgi:hypothetical protein